MRMSNLHEKLELKKGPWTREEDQKMCAYIEEHGHGNWRSLPEKAGLQRCGKSCRLRWTNYLRPDIKRGKFSIHEDKTIIRLHALLGNRWSAIATHMPKRTDNEIKNYWNTRLKKRLTRMGIDPVTHKPKNIAPTNSGQSKQTANINHLTQWETARLEAEVRLVRQSKYLRKPAFPPPPRCLDVLKVWEANKNGFFDLTKTVHAPNYNTSKDNYEHLYSNNSSTYDELKGKMENLLQHVEEDNNVMGLDCDFNNVLGPMELIHDGDYNCFDTNMIWDIENTEQCNELLKLVMNA